MLLLAAVTLAATATSILPDVNWYGSYARGQGALTVLAYLTLGLLVVNLVRTLAQARRLVVTMALSGVIPAAYGWVQHFGHDPLPWQQPDLTTRVPGTLGNPIFLGALLVMTIPLALSRLALAIRRPGDGSVDRGPLAPGIATGNSITASWTRCLGRPAVVLGWSAVLIVEIGGLIFTKSRGPFAGLLAALVVFGVGLAYAEGYRRLGRVTVGLGALALVVLVGINLLGVGALGRVQDRSLLRLIKWTPQASGSSEVRLLIWRPALDLVAQRPVLGCGPDTLLSCYYPVYPTALRHVEAPNAVPDRTHDIFLDAATETGLLGLLALLAFLGVAAATLARFVLQAKQRAERVLAVALLAALVGHVVEGAFGIAVVDTSLLTWLIAGLAGALPAMGEPAPDATPADMRRRPNPRRGAPGQTTARMPSRRAPLVAALSTATAGVLSLGEQADGPPPLSRAGAGKTGAGRADHGDKSARAARRVDILGPNRILVARILALGGLVATCWIAWRVVSLGVEAIAADVAARQGADLETVALANSGQAPLPAGRSPQPILALRQFAAASVARDAAIRQNPGQEEYQLDAGRTLVEWGQAAADVGGPAAAQARSLYAHALLDFGRAAHLNPYDPDPLRDTGKAYERWAALGHDPAASNTWNGELLNRAAQAFARAAGMAPHHPDPLTSWAQVLLWQGRPQQALDLADRALALDDQDGDGYRLRAEAELTLGQRADALADWRQALDDPTVGQRGPTAAHLALAEATWGQARCAAVGHARTAIAAGGLTTHDATIVAEIAHVDGPYCSKSPR